jgi:hypothetical protein
MLLMIHLLHSYIRNCDDDMYDCNMCDDDDDDECDGYVPMTIIPSKENVFCFVSAMHHLRNIDFQPSKQFASIFALISFK